jgi:superfamily II RNA helicase
MKVKRYFIDAEYFPNPGKPLRKTTIEIENDNGDYVKYEDYAYILRKYYNYKHHLIDLLDKYTMFLNENGYIDDDCWAEEPKAIDRFIKTLEDK